MPPVFTDFSGDFRVTVSRQVHQKTAASDAKKIDMLRSARGFADKSQSPAIGQGIDRAGFARVRPSSERDLYAGWGRQVPQPVYGGKKGCKMKNRHGGWSGLGEQWEK
jgi:hypothetical protein